MIKNFKLACIESNANIIPIMAGFGVPIFGNQYNWFTSLYISCY